jgi:hypothetical protein
MINQSETIGALAASLAKAQGSLNAALKDSKNPHLKNTYADLTSIWTAAREPLASNELAVIQTTDDDEGGQYLVTTLAHSSGEWIRGRLKIGTEGANKGVNLNQALGSSISYMRRYALAAIVGVIQDDDDGNASSGHSNTQQRQKAPPPRFQAPDEKQEIIASIQKGEALLDLNEFERNNSRIKHLGSVKLTTSNIDGLKTFKAHLLTKYKDQQTQLATASMDGEMVRAN